MKRVVKKLKKANWFARLIYFVLPIVYIITYVLFAKSVIALNGIENIFRFVLLIFFVAFILVYLYVGLIKLVKRKYVLFYILSIIGVLFIVVFSLGSTVINLVYDKLSMFNEKDKVTYTSYLVSLKDTELTDESILGMINDEKSIEGNILAKDIIKKNKLKQEIKEYSADSSDAYLEMLYALYAKEVDAIFISSNYVTLYSNEDDFENIALDTKVLYEASGLFKNEDTNIVSNKSLTEPFSVLILGVDSEVNGLNANAAFNGDTLILATFNPKTLSATLFSIPRDTFVPIACRNGAKAKINSSAAYGTQCVIDTIENLTDIKIDYYAKINFKGVVELVEAVGGVTVEVQQPDYLVNHGHECHGKICEQNSNRLWGDGYTVFIDPGLQTLNGEQALAYARCRGLFIESDIARNRHQQEIIMALAKKMMKLDSYNSFKKILDAVSNNIATNMSTNQILSSYNILKDMIGKALKNEEIINVQKTKLEIYSLPVYLPSGRYTSALGYYEDSLKEISKEMKINLGIEKQETVKTFSYSINEEYESYVAGAGKRSGTTNSVLTRFVNRSKAEAESYCADNNLDCSFVYVDSSSSYYNEEVDTDLIGSQNPHEGTIMDNVSSVTFYINGAN